MTKRFLAELVGTFVLVFGGCGSAVFGGAHEVMGLVGVSLAFGLSVLAMAYAVGGISGGHFNPAVTVGLAVAGRLPWREAPAYIAAQVVGALAAAGVLSEILRSNGAALGQFAANGWGPAGHHNALTTAGALLVELVATAVFLFVIVSVTTPGRATTAAPVVIGLTLTLLHLVTIPLTNTSVNPARSTSQALFAGGPWFGQLWLFWLAPLVGGALGAFAAAWLQRDERAPHPAR